MGRPADQFCKDNVEEYLAKGRWRCKHCKSVFSGSASRIRNHLSCQATVTDIRPCEAAPLSVREEASKRNSKKRRRILSSGEDNDGIAGANIAEVPVAPMETAFQVPSSNVVLSTHVDKRLEQEYTTTKLLVKSFIGQNIPIDFGKAPEFRDFLKSAAQHGIPPCLLRDDSVVIERSLSNIKHDVNDRLLKIADSWKITGCTVMCYSVDRNKTGEDPSDSEEEVVYELYGFYCPEGFIFIGGSQLDSSQRLKEAFKKHVLSLPIDDVTHQISHFSLSPVCEFTQFSNHYLDTDEIGWPMSCARETVDKLWTKICEKTGWVHELIQKSQKLYPTRSALFWGEKEADATSRILFKRFRAIMQQKDRLKPIDVMSLMELDIQEIIADNEYWSDGEKLIEALDPVMGIIDLKDTVVPTVGYLQVAVEEAKRTLKLHFEDSKYEGIWRCLDRFTLDWGSVSAYFNPFYDWRALSIDPSDEVDVIAVTDDVIDVLITDAEWYMTREDQKEKLEAEMKIYRDNNPFANLPPFEPECNLPDPVTLWNKYGGEFPLLKKFAIKILSQPTICMCNQVKKHIMRLQEEDNFILRLNYHMMRHTQLGYLQLINKPAERLQYHHRSSVQDDPHIGQIPEWMNEFISKSSNVLADGNYGYRAIAESLGRGQEKWHEVKQQLHVELNIQSWKFKDTFVHSDVDTISKALNYKEPGFAPCETWLAVADMGLLVASTFKAIFVVMGPTINHTFLPLYLLEGCPFSSVREIAICLISESSHFISLSLMENAPLPPVYPMWFFHHEPSTEGFHRFLKNRFTSYTKAEKMPPISIEINY